MSVPTIVVENLKDAKEKLESQIINASNFIGLAKELAFIKAIFIKPNLTCPKYREGVITRTDFVRLLVKVFISLNPNLKIYIGEGEGGYNSYSMDEVFNRMGYIEIEKDFSQVQVVNLSKTPSKTCVIDTFRGLYKLELPEIFFTEIDLSISCPVPKVHCMTKLSLSFKNQWGCFPDAMRLKNHYMFDYIISKVSDILKFKYAFLDGKYGLNKNGPIDGVPAEVDWFVASNSLGAFDRIVSEMMGFDWKTVGHLKMADRYGFIPGKEDIKIIGDAESLKRRFVLKRNFWNYPALAAFHSKILTNFVYISSFAKPLHDVMYTFRKRPIN